MDRKSIFYATVFNRELFRQQMILLNDHSIDYKVIDRSSGSDFRNLLRGYFETELHIAEVDYDRVDQN